MGGNVVSNLCSLPATDLNFTSELNRATAYQIKQAIETMKQNGGKNKGRIKACERELENRRLTKKDKHGKYVFKEHLSILCNTFSSEHRLKAILNKLGEYEDAERQGKLIKLPCKVGDTVWDNDFGRPCAYTITAFSFGECEEYICEPVTAKEAVFYYANSSGSITGSFAESEIGKSVFLNKSEAEAKLKEMEGADGN